MDYEGGKSYKMIYIAKDGKEKESEYTPETTVNIAGMINGFKRVTDDFFKLKKIDGKEITMESKKLDESKTLYDVLKELDKDIDIIDTDYDMMVAASVLDEGTSAYDIFISNLYKDLNVKDYNNDIAKVDVVRWVRDNKDILSERFSADEYGEDYIEETLVCDVMPSIISGGVSEEMYADLNSALGYNTKITESKEDEFYTEKAKEIYKRVQEHMTDKQRIEIFKKETQVKEEPNIDDFWDWFESLDSDEIEELEVKYDYLKEEKELLAERDVEDYRKADVKIETDKDLNINVKKYFKDFYKEHPEEMDEMINDVKDNLTFQDVVDGLNNGEDIYDVLGVGDSMVREQIFNALCDITDLDYDVFYYKWLGEPDEETLSMVDQLRKSGLFTFESKKVTEAKPEKNGEKYKFTDKQKELYDKFKEEYKDEYLVPMIKQGMSEDEIQMEFDDMYDRWQLGENKKINKNAKLESKLVEDDIDASEEDKTYPEELVDVDDSLEGVNKDVEIDLEKDLEAEDPEGSQEPTKKAVEQAIEEVGTPTDHEVIAVDVANSNLAVLIADEKGAIAGYEAFLAQAKDTVLPGLYDVLVKAISEIIKDEEDHINKLEVISGTFHFDKAPVKESKRIAEARTLKSDKDDFESDMQALDTFLRNTDDVATKEAIGIYNELFELMEKRWSEYVPLEENKKIKTEGFKRTDNIYDAVDGDLSDVINFLLATSDDVKDIIDKQDFSEEAEREGLYNEAIESLKHAADCLNKAYYDIDNNFSQLTSDIKKKL